MNYWDGVLLIRTWGNLSWLSDLTLDFRRHDEVSGHVGHLTNPVSPSLKFWGSQNKQKVPLTSVKKPPKKPWNQLENLGTRVV
jgi:hypothetical protein